MGLQSLNPFGKNFAPFEMPDDAPIRGVIGQRTPAERSAKPQSDNPFAPNFQPFYIPDNAPIRGVIGPRPTPTQKPISPRIERKPGPFDPGYVKPNTTMEPTDPAALNKYLNSAPDVAFVPDSVIDGSGGGRDNSRTNGNGVVQKGTDMSRSFNDLLATTNTSGYQPYSSNQLPGTTSNPFSRTAPKTQRFETGEESYTGNSLADFGGDGSAASHNHGKLRIETRSTPVPRGLKADLAADRADHWTKHWLIRQVSTHIWINSPVETVNEPQIVHSWTLKTVCTHFALKKR